MIKRYFYYYRDDRNRPMITVCAMISFEENETRLLARGLAFCHEQDNPSKGKGKSLAGKRATLAYDSGINYFPVLIREEFDHILDIVPYNDLHILEHKSCINPTPTDIEKRLMKLKPMLSDTKKRLMKQRLVNNDIIVLNEDDGEID